MYTLKKLNQIQSFQLLLSDKYGILLQSSKKKKTEKDLSKVKKENKTLSNKVNLPKKLPAKKLSIGNEQSATVVTKRMH